MTLTKSTRDHSEIRNWARQRGAIPSEVIRTHQDGETGILRFQFPATPSRNDANLREIS